MVCVLHTRVASYSLVPVTPPHIFNTILLHRWPAWPRIAMHVLEILQCVYTPIVCMQVYSQLVVNTTIDQQ